MIHICVITLMAYAYRAFGCAAKKSIVAPTEVTILLASFMVIGTQNSSESLSARSFLIMESKPRSATYLVSVEITGGHEGIDLTASITLVLTSSILRNAAFGTEENEAPLLSEWCTVRRVAATSLYMVMGYGLWVIWLLIFAQFFGYG